MLLSSNRGSFFAPGALAALLPNRKLHHLIPSYLGLVSKSISKDPSLPAHRRPRARVT